MMSVLSGIVLAREHLAELKLVSISEVISGRTSASKVSLGFARRVKSQAKRAARSGYCTQNKSCEGIIRFSVISLWHPLTCQFIMSSMKNHNEVFDLEIGYTQKQILFRIVSSKYYIYLTLCPKSA